MRITYSLCLAAAALALLSAGCAGPEQKLGRGINNLTEFTRMGELRRSIEQTTLWEGNDVGATTGFIRGFDRSMFRTAVGAYEVVTFPFPSYDPVIKPGNPVYPDMTVNPVYPDSYKPLRVADPLFDTDTALGFSGGDVAPFVPGSRFTVFGP